MTDRQDPILAITFLYYRDLDAAEAFWRHLGFPLVSDQGFAKIFRVDIVIFCQRVLRRCNKNRLVVKKRSEIDTGQILGIRGDHQIDLFAQQGW